MAARSEKDPVERFYSERDKELTNLAIMKQTDSADIRFNTKNNGPDFRMFQAKIQKSD